MNVITLLSRALEQNGVQPDSESLLYAFDSCNMMMRSWGIDGVFYTSREAFQIVAGQAQYEIGPTLTYVVGEGDTAYINQPDFDAVRPLRILSAWTVSGTIAANDLVLADDPASRHSDTTASHMMRFPLAAAAGSERRRIEIVARESDADLVSTVTTGTPVQLYYNPTMISGTITLWPVPAEDAILWLDFEKPLDSFTAMTQTVYMPPQYEAMIHWCLSEWMLPRYPSAQSGLIIGMADKIRTAMLRDRLSSIPRISSDPLAPDYSNQTSIDEG